MYFCYIGTPRERGILSWREDLGVNEGSGLNASSLYDIPFVTDPLRRFNWCSYVPVSPTFDKEIPVPSCNCSCWQKSDTSNEKRDTSAQNENGTQYAYNNDVTLEAIQVHAQDPANL